MMIEKANESQTIATAAPGEVREAVLAAAPGNPALVRLQERLRAGGGTGETITSYDRMHHRHSRS
jgi:hypothetical protein